MKRILGMLFGIFLVTSLLLGCKEPDVNGPVDSGSENENTGSGSTSGSNENNGSGSTEDNEVSYIAGEAEVTLNGSELQAIKYTLPGEGKLYFFSGNGGINIYGVKIGNKLWSVSDLSCGEITDETVLTSNGINAVALATSEKNLTIDSNSKSFGDVKFTQRLKLGGAGSKENRTITFNISSATDVIVYAMSSSSSASRPLKYEFVGGSVVIVQPTAITLSSSDLSINIAETQYATLTATLTPNNITSGYNGIIWSSSNEDVGTVNNGKITVYKAGTTTITAKTQYGNCTATCVVTVTGVIENGIRVTDIPTGWASYTGTKDLAGGNVTSPTNYGGNGGSVVTVSTRSDLQNYAKKGNYVIYIDGMIDMTDGMLPSKASESTTALDNWIKSKSSVATSLATWKTYYAGGNTNSADESGSYKTNRQTLANAWSSLITINVASNTTIIGLTNESGVKGGCFKISGKSNIVMRNLIIQDAYDPFPQIEKGDGFNANYDAIEISGGSKYVWIDHCTLRDTISKTDSDFDTVTLSDGVEKKYQVFDGLCDIKQASDFITVSYCKFMDHDKTQLIGHSSSYTSDTNHQTITLHNNYYLNCGQRLPMVRFATIHIYNNYYDTDGTGRKNSYCIGLRENNKVYAENNYFGNVTPVSNSQGSYYLVGNYGYDNKGSAAWTPSKYYSYKLLTAAEAKADVLENAGAGKLTVIK